MPEPGLQGLLQHAKHPNADKLSVCTVDVGPAGGVKTIEPGTRLSGGLIILRSLTYDSTVSLASFTSGDISVRRMMTPA